MFMRNLWVLLMSSLLSAAIGASDLGHSLKPALGKPAPANFNSVIDPSGDGLPVGKGSTAEGEVVYRNQCAACHGPDGKQPGNALVGGQGTLASPQPVKTVGSYWPYATTLFDYIRRAMPYDQQKSLSDNEVYAVSAYVLLLNGIVEEGAVLSEDNLAAVKMPNRAGFINPDD